MKSLTENIAKLEAQNLTLVQRNKALESNLAINNLTFLNIVSKNPDGILVINYQKKCCTQIMLLFDYLIKI